MRKELVVLLLISNLASANPSVRCWGKNTEGQSAVPASLKLRPALVQPVLARTSKNKTCVLDKSGKVSCWGLSFPDVSKLQNLTGVLDFASSIAGSCAITSAGVQCFSATNSSVFEQPPALVKPKTVTVGGTFACALDANGVSCWGDDGNYYTGITSVPTLKNPRRLVVSLENACVIDDTGVQCWGSSDYGINSVPSLTNPTDVMMGLNYACARDKTGVVCWGGSYGSNIPVVPNDSGSVSFASGQGHICGLGPKGVQCWGDNTFGQLTVPNLTHPSAIFADAMGNQTCALDDSGMVCWGENEVGQSSLPAVDSLSTGESNTCAVSQGLISCWGKGNGVMTGVFPITDAYKVAIGSNFACTLDIQTEEKNACWGDPSVNSYSAFVQLPTVDYSYLEYLYTANASTMTAGFHHACVSNENQTTCWGNNDFGQAKVPANFAVSLTQEALSAGGYHTCGIDPKQGLLCWGKNQFGQITVPKLKNPRQVSAGFAHTCALDDNGITCWGRSTEGQTLVPMLKHPRSVQAGGYHTCALDDDGIHCWGENSFGQSEVPHDLEKSISMISVGLFNTCVVTK